MSRHLRYLLLPGLIILAYITLYLSFIGIIDIHALSDHEVYHALEFTPFAAPFGGAEFYAKVFSLIRPLTVPLIYKILGNDVQIAAGQSIIYVMSWMIFGITFSASLKKKWLKSFALGLILLFSLASNLFIWPKILQSESLYISFFVLSLSFLFWLGRLSSRELPTHIKILIGVAGSLFIILFCQTRDSNMAVLAFFHIPVLLFMALGQRPQNKTQASICWFILPLLVGNILFQNYHMQKVEVDTWSIVNNISLRILPYPDRTSWFVKNGMPVNEKVLRFTNKFSWEFDRDWIGFGDFLPRKGREVYLKFLISHPYYSLKSFMDNLRHIIGGRLYGYWGTPQRNPLQQAIDWIVWPMRWPSLILYFLALMLNIRLLASSPTQSFKTSLITIFFLLSSAIPLAFILFHAAPDDLERHCLPVQIHVRLGIVFMLLLVIDNFSIIKNMVARIHKK